VSFKLSTKIIFDRRVYIIF